MWIEMLILMVVIIAVVVYEYRLRKPDQLVLLESNGKIKERKTRFYPRHFSLALPNTTQSSQLIIEATAKGNIDIRIKLAVTVAASLNNIPELIRVGGWNSNAVTKSAKELETIIHSLVKEFTENFEIEELTSEKIYNHLREKVNVSREKLGLEIISLTVQSFEASDPKISEAMKQQESARIFEQTEILNQKARVTAAKTKLKADEEIALMENELELKKYELKKAELEKESAIAHKRVEDELKRKRMQLEFDNKELELLKNNPELLMLTPQAARLAEASQSLKNARTIVSLSPNEISQSTSGGTNLIDMFQKFLQNAVSSFSPRGTNPPGTDS
ncbi:MAG: SPFH domain-containing protein [Bacteroidota bacterium]